MSQVKKRRRRSVPKRRDQEEEQMREDKLNESVEGKKIPVSDDDAEDQGVSKRANYSGEEFTDDQND